MKARIIDRILILVYGLIGLFMIVSACIGFGWQQILTDKANELMSPAFVKASKYAVLAFFAIYSVYVIWFALHRPKREEKFVNVSSGENGFTRVSLFALDQLVADTTCTVGGVQNVRTAVMEDNDVVKVFVRMDVDPSVNIPKASLQLKDLIRNRMEAVTGINVRDINISVDRIVEDIRLINPDYEPATVAYEEEKAPEAENEERAASAADGDTLQVTLPTAEEIENAFEDEEQAASEEEED